jgi:hypothetical protein
MSDQPEHYVRRQLREGVRAMVWATARLHLIADEPRWRTVATRQRQQVRAALAARPDLRPVAEDALRQAKAAARQVVPGEAEFWGQPRRRLRLGRARDLLGPKGYTELA